MPAELVLCATEATAQVADDCSLSLTGAAVATSGVPRGRGGCSGELLANAEHNMGDGVRCDVAVGAAEPEAAKGSSHELEELESGAAASWQSVAFASGVRAL